MTTETTGTDGQVRIVPFQPSDHPYPGRIRTPDAELGRYGRALWNAKYRIVLVVVVSMILAGVATHFVTPRFESTAVLEVDWQTPRAVLGAESQPASPSDTDEFINTQLRLLESDAVLRPVVQQMRLT